MSFLSQANLPQDFPPYRALRDGLGFLPNLFRAQSLLPRLIEAEAGIAGSVLLEERALTRVQKESVLLTLAARYRSTYCVTSHARILGSLGVEEARLDALLRDHRQAGLSPADTALIDFALKLGRFPTAVAPNDVEVLRGHGFRDEQLLEAVLITALTNFLCTLAAGLGAAPDFPPRPTPSFDGGWPAPEAQGRRVSGPYLAAEDMTTAFPPFAFFQESFGFVPNIFRAQTLRPDVLEAEARAVGTILLTQDVLTRVQKEYILLVVSAANLNTYCVAVHCEMLRALGIPEEASDEIALDHRASRIPEPDKALLDFALSLAQQPAKFGSEEIARLRRAGFSEEQVLEAIVMTSLTQFLNTLQMGLGTVPDFHPRLVFGPEIQGIAAAEPAGANLSSRPERRMEGDPDAGLVSLVRKGDLNAFEELVRRHQDRVYRTLIGITGHPEEAEDGTQNVFLRAFERLDQFEGSSRFSTWLTRIAINEGVQRRRGRKDSESLPEDAEEREEDFRPRQLRAWMDDPEQAYARTELRRLVEQEILKLPARYRAAVMLRDVGQLSTAEAAAALGLPVPTLKTRLLRGRMMLREALSSRFSAVAPGHV